MLHQAWLVWAELWSEQGLGLLLHYGVLVMPNPNALPAQDMSRIIDEFARNLQPEDMQGRLLRWRPGIGWEDRSSVR
jgi:hypothetical protein